jgi:hypothetical protein
MRKDKYRLGYIGRKIMHKEFWWRNQKERAH